MHRLGRHGVHPEHDEGNLLMLSDTETVQETVSCNFVDGKLKRVEDCRQT